LKIKKFNNKELNGVEYYEYLEECCNQFHSNMLLVTPSTFNAVVENYMTNMINLCFAHYKERFISFANANSVYNEMQVEYDHKASKKQAKEKYEISYKMGTAEQTNRFKLALMKQIDEDNKNYVLIVKPYLNKIKVLDQELMSTRKSYENRIKEKDEIINDNKFKFERQLKLKTADIEKLNCDLTAANQTISNLRSQLNNAQMSHKTVMDEKEKLTQEVMYLKSYLKQQESKQNKLSWEIESKDKEIYNILKEKHSLISEKSYFSRELDKSKNENQHLNDIIRKMKTDHQQEIALREQNKNQRKNKCIIL